MRGTLSMGEALGLAALEKPLGGQGFEIFRGKTFHGL